VPRKRRTPPPPADAGITAEGLERYYVWLGRYLLNGEPDSVAAGTYERIGQRRERLNASQRPVEERITALEAFMDELGVLDAARRFAGRFHPDRSVLGAAARVRTGRARAARSPARSSSRSTPTGSRRARAARARTASNGGQA
jgi:hypothetical protein